MLLRLSELRMITYSVNDNDIPIIIILYTENNIYINSKFISKYL